MANENEKTYYSAWWYSRLKESSNDCFMRFYGEKCRYLVLMGGAGSGKSIFAGRKLLERVSSEEGHRVLVLRKVARTLRESCFAQLVGQIGEYYNKSDFSVNKTDMTVTHTNGSKIIFAGLDDAEKLKSIYNITAIWIEEASEINKADFNQLDIRLRGKTKYYKQIIFTFNPISARHWLKKRFFDRNDENAVTHISTYLNNRFLDEEAKNVLLSYRETDEYYYEVYALAHWGAAGKSVFDRKALYARLNVCEKIKKTKGFFSLTAGREAHFCEDEGGNACIYRYPEEKHRYLLGGDTAGEGSDYFAACVIDNATAEQVATLRMQSDEDVYAESVFALGSFYNNALVAIEANFSSYPIKLLTKMGYKNQYVRMREDAFSGGFVRSFGFKTTSVTRPVIISELIKTVRETPEILNDAVTVEEMLTFVRNEKNRAEAASGCHDDAVMALAIANYLRSEVPIAESEKKKPSPDDFGIFTKKSAFSEAGEKVAVV